MLSKEHIFSGNPLSCKSLLLCAKHKGLSQALLGQNPKMHVCQISREIQNKPFLFPLMFGSPLSPDTSPKKKKTVTIFEGSVGMGRIGGWSWSCTSSARTSSDASTSDLPSATSAASSPVRVTPALKTYRKNHLQVTPHIQKNTSSNLSSNSPFEKHHETSTIETFSRLKYVTLPKTNITPDK